MSDDKPSLHIDTDWKRQAQEEKRRQAEREQEERARQETAAADKAAAPAPPPGVAPTAAAAAEAAAAGRGIPVASFASIVQSLAAQTLFYLGELQGGERSIDLDLAKHQIDTLGVLEDKTKNNLQPDEQRLLDATLYEMRMRFVALASQFA